MQRLQANLLGGLAHGRHEATLRKFSNFSSIEITTVVAYLSLPKLILDLSPVLRYALSTFSGNLGFALRQSFVLI